MSKFQEVKSIQFKYTSPSQTKKQVPISLVLGMEKVYQFSEGNQVDGERITAQYISDTYSYYAIGEELSQVSKTEEPERWEGLKAKENKMLDQVRKLQQHSLIIEFSKAVREEQQRKLQEKQLEDMQKTMKEIFSGPSALPTLEGL